MANMVLQKLVHAQEEKDFSVVEFFVYLVYCMFSPLGTYVSMRIGSYREAFAKSGKRTELVSKI